MTTKTEKNPRGAGAKKGNQNARKTVEQLKKTATLHLSCDADFKNKLSKLATTQGVSINALCLPVLLEHFK